MRPASNNAMADDGPEYFDVVLFGREKQGLTTLADKLLAVASTDPAKIQILQPGDSADDKKCELRSNETTKIRVVDVPGFSGSTSTQLGTLKSNTQIIQGLGGVLDDFELHVRRIVYFIPNRGPYEKADGATQEELKLLCHYFGREVFDCMVVAATQHPQEKYQKLGFDEKDIELTGRAFHVALKSAIGEDIACPPIVYIGYKDSSEETLQKIKYASVQNETTVPLHIKNVGPLFPDEDSDDESGDDFIKITSGNFEVGDGAGLNIVKVHPSFDPKYNVVQKIVGGFVNMATLGYYPDQWPCNWYTSTEEVCRECGSPPDAEGCVPISSD